MGPHRPFGGIHVAVTARNLDDALHSSTLKHDQILREMTTHRGIVDALADASSRNEAVVLATVVRVTGSSYGGVGARMVVNVDGSSKTSMRPVQPSPSPHAASSSARVSYVTTRATPCA